MKSLVPFSHICGLSAFGVLHGWLDKAVVRQPWALGNCDRLFNFLLGLQPIFLNN